MNFERGIDPKEAMGIGYAGLIRMFDKLGQPYGFNKENILINPKFYHHNNETLKWIQHWGNSWGDLISLYEDEKGKIRVFSYPANGDSEWDQSVLDWMEPTNNWKSNFEY